MNVCDFCLQIFDKHISPSGAGYIALDADLAAAIQTQFDESKLRKDVFDAAVVRKI
jgi:hypothetical protein